MIVSCFIEFIKRVEERDKIRGLLSILSLFCNKFKKFNNTGARMLDSIYHIKIIFMKTLGICHMPDVKSVISLRFPKICKLLVVYLFQCIALFHSQTRRHMISTYYYILAHLDLYMNYRQQKQSCIRPLMMLWYR